MIKKLIITLLLLSHTAICYGGEVSIFHTYSTNDEVNATRLNGNTSNIVTVLNGGLDNDNANTSAGYRFFEVLGSLPTAGTEGRVVFLTTDDTINFDTGSAWRQTVTALGTPAQGDIVYHNGTSWTRLAAGTADYPLVTNGSSANPAYEQLATAGITDLAVTNAKIANTTIDLTTKVTGVLPIANGGLNLSSAGGTSNRALITTDGTAWSVGQIALATMVSGTLPIANGGTGTTSTTFCNLTTNVTGTLPVANGGTGITTAFFKTGEYTGDGATTKTITGIGFQPKIILLYKQTGTGPNSLFLKTNQDTTFTKIIDAGGGYYENDYIISLDADGFTVGDGTSGSVTGINVAGDELTYIVATY